MAKQINPYPVRLDEETYEKVRLIGQIHHRSINGEIMAIVDRYVRDYERKNGPLIDKP